MTIDIIIIDIFYKTPIKTNTIFLFAESTCRITCRITPRECECIVDIQRIFKVL